MYLYHFGFSELPFTLTPNTGFYCELQVHEEALQVLKTALNTGEGFIKVTGEVGTGKTLLCRKLLNDVSSHFVCAYVPNPYLTPHELRLAIAAELDVKGVHDADAHQLTRSIEQKLLELNRSGHSVVLIIDEAQALPTESLEALRLLSNLETETRKLVQLVLFGQPELDERLEKRELRQLLQRIGFSYRLNTLTVEEMSRYIKHRFKCSGYKGVEIFPESAVKWIHRGSRGVPRVANILCHKSLMVAYGNGRYQVNIADVKAAIADTESAFMPRRAEWIWFALSFILVVIVAVAVANGLGWI